LVGSGHGSRAAEDVLRLTFAFRTSQMSKPALRRRENHMPVGPISSAAKLVLNLQGKPAGFLSSTSGGEPFAMLSESPLPTGVVSKQIAELGYEPITFEVDLPLEKPLYDWLDTFLNRSQQLTGGSISFVDVSLVERRRLEWDDALITEVTFPAAEATSKDPARLKWVIQPTRTRRVQSSGARTIAPKTKVASIVSNFSFVLAGLEAPTKRVSRIEPLVVRQPVASVEGRLKAGTLEIPAVKLVVPMSAAEPLFDWFDDFVVQGHNAPTYERNGLLSLLDAQLKNVLFGISLQNLGVVRVAELREAAGVGSIERVCAELYCEQMQLSPPTALTSPR